MNNIVFSEVSMNEINGLSPILSGDARITAVKDIEEQIFEIDFNALDFDGELFVESDSRGILTKIGDYFRNLMGISVNKSVAQIYIESQAVAKKAFPGAKAKARVELNFASYTLSDAELKEDIEKLFPGTRVTFRSKN